MNATPVTGEAVGLLKVTVNSEAADCVIVPGLNDMEAVGASTTVSSSVAEVLALPMLTAAVLMMWLPTVAEPDTVASMVKVRLLLLGRLAEGMVMPDPCMAATVALGQAAPFALEQLTLLTVRLVTAGSVNTESCRVPPELLVITTV